MANAVWFRHWSQKANTYVDVRFAKGGSFIHALIEDAEVCKAIVCVFDDTVRVDEKTELRLHPPLGNVAKRDQAFVVDVLTMREDVDAWDLAAFEYAFRLLMYLSSDDYMHEWLAWSRGVPCKTFQEQFHSYQLSPHILVKRAPWPQNVKTGSDFLTYVQFALDHGEAHRVLVSTEDDRGALRHGVPQAVREALPASVVNLLHPARAVLAGGIVTTWFCPDVPFGDVDVFVLAHDRHVDTVAGLVEAVRAEGYGISQSSAAVLTCVAPECPSLQIILSEARTATELIAGFDLSFVRCFWAGPAGCSLPRRTLSAKVAHVLRSCALVDGSHCVTPQRLRKAIDKGFGLSAQHRVDLDMVSLDHTKANTSPTKQASYREFTLTPRKFRKLPKGERDAKTIARALVPVQSIQGVFVRYSGEEEASYLCPFYMSSNPSSVLRGACHTKRHIVRPEVSYWKFTVGDIWTLPELRIPFIPQSPVLLSGAQSVMLFEIIHESDVAVYQQIHDKINPSVVIDDDDDEKYVRVSLEKNTRLVRYCRAQQVRTMMRAEDMNLEEEQGEWLPPGAMIRVYGSPAYYQEGQELAWNAELIVILTSTVPPASF